MIFMIYNIYLNNTIKQQQQECGMKEKKGGVFQEGSYGHVCSMLIGLIR